MESQLTVFFDGQFWVAVIELNSAGSLRSARYIFGPEPSDAEIFAWVHSPEFMEFLDVAETTQPIIADTPKSRSPSPKRAQRVAREAMLTAGPSSKAEEAMRLNRELNKKERKGLTAADRSAKQERRFVLKQKQKKERHRGR
jgi:Protein of unknown function (DUF2992)